MHLKRLIGAILISLALIFVPFIASTAFAVFNPSFTATLSTVTFGASVDVRYIITNPAGSERVLTNVIKIPAGVVISDGSSFANNAQLGNGSFTAVFGGVTQTFTFVILNDTNLLGHRLHIKADFAPVPFIIDNIFLDGDPSSGYTLNLPSEEIGFDLPSVTDFTFYGTVGGTNFIVAPSLPGEYTFSSEFVSTLGTSITRTITGNLPAQTPSGTNVTNDFNGGISINFNRVLGQGGQTTITSSASPPAAGTGEFQLSGVYYDFNTTANIRCPCTVTIPYDPVTTPNPRIYHLEDGVWVDATTSVDTVNHTVTGTVSSFSFFAVGSPNYSVDWQKKIEKFLEKDNPFDIKEDKKLKIEFGLLDADGQKVSPENVTVEVWQILDEGGNTVGPTKTATLTPDLKEKKDQFKAELNLRETELALGTYKIRVIVENTTASQTPDTASFTVVEKH